MTHSVNEDRFLGALFEFPKLLHARASLSFDISPVSLQKAFFRSLASLENFSVPREVTVADREGYSLGAVRVLVGVGDGEGFDLLDDKEEERVMSRIENRGAFDVLDLSLRLKYRIEGSPGRRVHQDRYLVRLVFRPGNVEVLLHHLRGLRRVEGKELVDLMISHLNGELEKQRFPLVKIDSFASI